VFGDRLVGLKDLGLLEDMVMENVIKLFSVSKQEVFSAERLIFGDFSDGNTEEIRPYKFIPDLNAMVEKIEEYLENYNGATKNPMRLVMFLDACDHVARICRILR